MTLSDDQAIFRGLMITNMRRLTDRAGVYISRMSDRDREVVLSSALDLAYHNREAYNPLRMSLMRFWDLCLRDALMYRKVWPRRIVGGYVYDYTSYILRSIPEISAVNEVVK